jgi:hypothetical protein
MITAPISSFNVSLPGPSCWVGLGDGDGDDAAEGVLDGRDGLDTAPVPPHEMSRAANNAGVSRLIAAPMCTPR